MGRRATRRKRKWAADRRGPDILQQLDSLYNCTTIGFSIRNFKDLASVLELLSFALTVRYIEVFRLTLLNKPVIIKLTEMEESLEGNPIESRTEEGNFPT